MSSNFGNDSFDELLADFDASPVQTSSTAIPSGSKKPKISNDSRSAADDISDSILANITLPGVPEPQRIASSDSARSSQSTNSSKPSTVAASVNTNASRTNCVLVNPKQRGNPILKSISNVPWEFDDSIIPDYVVGVTAGILYLSLRYHQLNPDYIHNRLKELGKRFELRVLLVQVDTKVRNVWRKQFGPSNIHFDFSPISLLRIQTTHWKIWRKCACWLIWRWCWPGMPMKPVKLWKRTNFSSRDRPIW